MAELRRYDKHAKHPTKYSTAPNLLQHKPDMKSKAFLPALSIKEAAIATENNLTAPTIAASYWGA